MYKIPTPNKTCVICEKIFERPARRPLGQFKNQKVCSVKCRTEYLTRFNRAQWKDRLCRLCNGVIPKRESRRLYCGIECLGKAHRGSFNPMWKGGRRKHGRYIMLLVKDHPFADRNGYVFEHRIVVENWLKEKIPDSELLVEINNGKFLSPDVIVHHKNHDKSDNSISNLYPAKNQREHFHFNYCPFCAHCTQKSGELMGTPSGQS